MFSEHHTLLVLTLILFLGLILPELFKKLKLPSITALILFGAFLGPHGINFIQSNEVIEFFGFLGFTFLMFMAGLETSSGLLEKSFKEISILSLANSLIPFFTGAGITYLAGYSFATAALVGAIFMSSSVAVIFQILPSFKKIKKKEKQIMIGALAVEDTLSLVVLAVLFQIIAPQSSLPLPIYLAILFGAVLLIKIFLPKFATYFIKRNFLNKAKEEYEGEVRFIIVLLTLVLLLFSALGVHPILAAFLVGLLLSDVVTSETIHTKFHTLSYGLFIPVFFFISGMEINMEIFKNISLSQSIILYLTFGLLTSKFFSGYFAGKFIKLTKQTPSIFGVLSMAQLTTTLAATYSAASIGILDQTLTTTIILLAVVTNVAVPILLRYFKH